MMAEGGPANLDDTPRSSVVSRPLQCLICLGNFLNPKSLPCSHSFCQECLSMYIINELSETVGPPTSFSCPVCLRTTSPISQTEDSSLWAQQFQTNSLVTSILEEQHVEKGPYHCTPCKMKEHTNIFAYFWCKKTRAFYCVECKTNFHDIVHTECDLTKLRDGEIPMLKRKTTLPRCATHNQKMDYYCEDHKCLGCSECIREDHTLCDAVSTSDDYVHKLQTSCHIPNLIESLKEGASEMKSVIVDFKQQCESLSKEKHLALESITDLRKKIDCCLDNMQQDITDDLQVKFKEINRDLEDSKQKFERMRLAMETTLEWLERSIDRDEHIQTISLFERGRTEISAFGNMIYEVMSSTPSVHIKHGIRLDFTKFTRNAALFIGEIVITKVPRNLPLGCNVLLPLSKRQAKEISKINIKLASDETNCKVNGVAYLPGCSFVVSDSGNCKLKLFTEKGHCMGELEIPRKPRNICRIDNNILAVVTYPPCHIHIVEVKSSKLFLCSEIEGPEKQCSNVVYADGNLIVSGINTLYAISIDGINCKHIFKTRSKCLYLAYDSATHHILTSYRSSTVGRVSVISLKSAEEVDALNVDSVKYAVGMDIDTESNVYVCGRDSNNIIQMSIDGTNVRELLTSADGIHKPRAISVYGNKFVVTNESDDQRNYVHLFRLV